MIINNQYSHKGGEEYIKKHHLKELEEVYEAVKNMNVKQALSKKTHEKTKSALLFSPINMNSQLKEFLSKKRWIEKRIHFKNQNAFREIDGLKNRVGLEIQFGKYAFMAYDIFSKMPIFKNRNLIDCGIELVLSNSMIKHMSTGVSSFRQIILDITASNQYSEILNSEQMHKYLLLCN